MLVSLVCTALRGHIDVRPALPSEAMVMSTVLAAAKGQVWVLGLTAAGGRVGWGQCLVCAVARSHVEAHDLCFH